MKNPVEKPARTSFWEISAEDHGADVTEYVQDVSGVLDFCARVLFANILFEASIITIRYPEGGLPQTLGFYYPAKIVPNGPWLMKTLTAGKVRCRWLGDAIEAFGMLKAELNSGTTKIIQFWSSSCACPDDDPVPGVPPSVFPFA
jgi:hypothetical protein